MAASRANVQQRRHPDCRRGVRTFLATKATPDWLAGGDDQPESAIDEKDLGSEG
jgi:hypothetical protein